MPASKNTADLSDLPDKVAKIRKILLEAMMAASNVNAIPDVLVEAEQPTAVPDRHLQDDHSGRCDHSVLRYIDLDHDPPPGKYEPKNDTGQNLRIGYRWYSNRTEHTLKDFQSSSAIPQMLIVPHVYNCNSETESQAWQPGEVATLASLQAAVPDGWHPISSADVRGLPDFSFQDGLHHYSVVTLASNDLRRRTIDALQQYWSQIEPLKQEKDALTSQRKKSDKDVERIKELNRSILHILKDPDFAQLRAFKKDSLEPYLQSVRRDVRAALRHAQNSLSSWTRKAVLPEAQMTLVKSLAAMAEADDRTGERYLADFNQQTSPQAVTDGAAPAGDVPNDPSTNMLTGRAGEDAVDGALQLLNLQHAVQAENIDVSSQEKAMPWSQLLEHYGQQYRERSTMHEADETILGGLSQIVGGPQGRQGSTVPPVVFVRLSSAEESSCISDANDAIKAAPSFPDFADCLLASMIKDLRAPKVPVISSALCLAVERIKVDYLEGMHQAGLEAGTPTTDPIDPDTVYREVNNVNVTKRKLELAMTIAEKARTQLNMSLDVCQSHLLAEAEKVLEGPLTDEEKVNFASTQLSLEKECAREDFMLQAVQAYANGIEWNVAEQGATEAMAEYEGKMAFIPVYTGPTTFAAWLTERKWMKDDRDTKRHAAELIAQLEREDEKASCKTQERNIPPFDTLVSSKACSPTTDELGGEDVDEHDKISLLQLFRSRTREHRQQHPTPPRLSSAGTPIEGATGRNTRSRPPFTWKGNHALPDGDYSYTYGIPRVYPGQRYIRSLEKHRHESSFAHLQGGWWLTAVKEDQDAARRDPLLDADRKNKPRTYGVSVPSKSEVESATVMPSDPDQTISQQDSAEFWHHLHGASSKRLSREPETIAANESAPHGDSFEGHTEEADCGTPHFRPRGIGITGSRSKGDHQVELRDR